MIQVYTVPPGREVVVPPIDSSRVHGSATGVSRQVEPLNSSFPSGVFADQRGDGPRQELALSGDRKATVPVPKTENAA